MSTRIATKGVVIKHAATATPTVTLAGVRSVQVNGGERGVIESTCHDSTTREYISAPLADTFGLTITVAHDPADAGHEAIRAAQAAGTLYYFTLILPDAGTAQWAFSGYLTGFTPASLSPADGLMECSFTYKANAVATFTQ